MSTVSLEFCSGREGRRSYSRKTEEYIADFTLIAKRILDEEEHKIFRFHFLLGADWRLCCRQLKMDRGNFFHAVYRIQQKLGKTFAELEPYSLYPVDEYFAATFRKEKLTDLCRDLEPVRTRTRGSRPNWEVPLSA
jgi:hypothetical protein